ncbi:MAG: NADH:ubiquinone reductase (Na(+)-transporting) subunit B [Desulfobacteraceae bacterium]|nr:NADH:ubiquinone reductase (Na(+)-transporting) subunit B [Desulfobacteraceae bacterium]
MNPIQNFFDKQRKHFEPGGRLAPWEPFYEAMERVFFASPETSPQAPHCRDSLSVQRYMMLVIIMVLPCLLFGIYNAGYQSFKAAGQSADVWTMLWFGAKIVMPLVIISYIFGFGWEIIFSAVRKHPISEGVFVSAMLFPLTLPPTTPWWQAAIGISFGVVIGKEVFGGTGRNFLNPALTGRAFLYFAYPVQMSGDAVWIVVCQNGNRIVDAISSATPLAVASTVKASGTAETALTQAGYSIQTLFIGLYPDSIGASSVVLCIIGAVVLMIWGVASYRIILGDIFGVLSVGYLLNLLANDGSMPYFSMNPWYHLLIGGTAFGFAFMTTDPVSAPDTHAARWVYGYLIGALTVIIRVFNPAFPEGIMLAILFMNIFAPLLDQIAVKVKLKKRIANV